MMAILLKIKDILIAAFNVIKMRIPSLSAILAFIPSLSSALAIALGIAIGYFFHPILKPFIAIAIDFIKLILKL